jgi:hypothetical protein
LRDTPGGVRPADQTLALDGQAVVTAKAQQALAADDEQEHGLRALLFDETSCALRSVESPAISDRGAGWTLVDL